MPILAVAVEEAETQRSSDRKAELFVLLSSFSSDQDEQLECRDMVVVVKTCGGLLELYQGESERFLMHKSNLQ